MEIWVVVGFTGQVYGVYTTKRKALHNYETLKRDGVPVIEPIHSHLNQDREPVHGNHTR